MRRYDDLVDVREGAVHGQDGEVPEQGAAATASTAPPQSGPQQFGPQQFLWHGRLYVVRDVLAHWVETGAWWRAPSAQVVYGLAEEPAVAVQSAAVQSAAVQSARPQSRAVADDGERQVWRVEASAGRAQGTGVFDLSLDTAAGVWRLTRALD